MDEVVEVRVPTEISESLARFRVDHPAPDRVAFIMMQFGRTGIHRQIVDGIRAVLGRHGIVAVRADDKEYHESLFENIRTYMHGCRFGVAVFERIESELFNPNVALEVGYMLAMRKQVCLLKDRTLRSLNSDLIGRLYREFDPQRAQDTIFAQLTAWLSEKGLGVLWATDTGTVPSGAIVLFKKGDSGESPFYRTSDGSIAALLFRSMERATYYMTTKGLVSDCEARELPAAAVVEWLEGARESSAVTTVVFDANPHDAHYNARPIPISVAAEIFRTATAHP